MYGGEEYDGRLSDSNILGAIHEEGKTKWLETNWVGSWQQELWLLVPDCRNPGVRYPMYRISVETFYHLEETWLDRVKEWFGRI